MTDPSIRRIQHDIKELSSLNRDVNMEVEDIKHITCYIHGPDDTVYEGGYWKIAIEFPDKYPYKSPSIGFVDKIFHPNIDFQSGSICLNALNEEWRPIYTLKHIIETFLPQLLTYPNPEDPLNINAAKLYTDDIEQYNTRVKDIIDKYDTFKKKEIDN